MFYSRPAWWDADRARSLAAHRTGRGCSCGETAVSNDQRADSGRSLAKPSKGRVPSCSRKLLDVNAARSGKLDRVDGLCDRADGASLIHTARVDALVARERLQGVVGAWTQHVVYDAVGKQK